jgi:hypothetical protein
METNDPECFDLHISTDGLELDKILYCRPTATRLGRYYGRNAKNEAHSEIACPRFETPVDQEKDPARVFNALNTLKDPKWYDFMTDQGRRSSAGDLIDCPEMITSTQSEQSSEAEEADHSADTSFHYGTYEMEIQAVHSPGQEYEPIVQLGSTDTMLPSSVAQETWAASGVAPRICLKELPPLIDDDQVPGRIKYAAATLLSAWRKWKKAAGDEGINPNHPLKRQCGEFQASQKRRKNTDGRVMSGSQAPTTSTTGAEPNIGTVHLLACPFWKHNPERHRHCIQHRLSKISYVKQHLYRCHVRPIYCSSCMQEFADEALRADHERARSCERQPVRDFDGLTHTQQRQLHSRPPSGTAEREQWFRIWDVVFPGLAQPRSPYLPLGLSEDLCSDFQYQTEHGSDVLRETLVASGVLVAESADDALSVSLQSGLQRIYDHWTQRRLDSRRHRTGGARRTINTRLVLSTDLGSIDGEYSTTRTQLSSSSIMEAEEGHSSASRNMREATEHDRDQYEPSDNADNDATCDKNTSLSGVKADRITTIPTAIMSPAATGDSGLGSNRSLLESQNSPIDDLCELVWQEFDTESPFFSEFVSLEIPERKPTKKVKAEPVYGGYSDGYGPGNGPLTPPGGQFSGPLLPRPNVPSPPQSP